MDKQFKKGAVASATLAINQAVLSAIREQADGFAKVSPWLRSAVGTQYASDSWQLKDALTAWESVIKDSLFQDPVNDYQRLKDADLVVSLEYVEDQINQGLQSCGYDSGYQASNPIPENEPEPAFASGADGLKAVSTAEGTVDRIDSIAKSKLDRVSKVGRITDVMVEAIALIDTLAKPPASTEFADLIRKSAMEAIESFWYA